MRSVPQIAIDFTRLHEGCRLVGYADVGGCATVGFGHCGPEVKVGQAISQDLADTYLREDMAIAAKRLAGVVDEAVLLKLTDHQYAALLSFVFNCGQRPTATLWKLVNAGRFDQVPDELMKWVHVGKTIVPGLVNRRQAERQLWLTPDDAKPAPPPPAPSSAVTRDAVQPVAGGFWSRLFGRAA